MSGVVVFKMDRSFRFGFGAALPETGPLGPDRKEWAFQRACLVKMRGLDFGFLLEFLWCVERRKVRRQSPSGQMKVSVCSGKMLPKSCLFSDPCASRNNELEVITVIVWLTDFTFPSVASNGRQVNVNGLAQPPSRIFRARTWRPHSRAGKAGSAKSRRSALNAHSETETRGLNDPGDLKGKESSVFGHGRVFVWGAVGNRSRLGQRVSRHK